MTMHDAADQERKKQRTSKKERKTRHRRVKVQLSERKNWREESGEETGGRREKRLQPLRTANCELRSTE